MAETNKICGRAGIYSHLYGFNGDPNRVSPFCSVAERVLGNSMLAPAVLIDDRGQDDVLRVMQVVQDEYAVSVLGTAEAFKGTCLELCGKCPFREPVLPKGDRPLAQKYKVFDTKSKTPAVAEFEIDPRIIQAVEEEACLNGKPIICQPEFAVVTVPNLALGEVRIGRRKFKESFLGVLSRTLSAPLVDLLLYHSSFSNGRASLAHYEIAKKLDVL